MNRPYATPQAFKQALEQRLRTSLPAGMNLNRRRQLLIFDRYLARIVQVFGDAATLKGGLALELRLERARATKDIDLRLMGPPDDVLARLQEAGRLNLGDFLSFEVRLDPRQPIIKNDGMKYDGIRFRAECKLASKVYGAAFGVDVAVGDPILGEPDVLVAEDVLGFAGIEPPTLRIYPIETHLAEKLHAYTMPRAEENSRVKDLPDMALIGTITPLDAARVQQAIELTFKFRGTHGVPASLPPPPPAWQTEYARIAAESGLPWATLADAEGAVRALLDPLLGGSAGAVWDPAAWSWLNA